jgi:hypothetical protein
MGVNPADPGRVEELRIPDRAASTEWAEISREYVQRAGLAVPVGCRVVHGCIVPEAPPAPAPLVEASATPPALILAGMHRSGTSLLARFLMATGVSLGESLIGPLPSNPFGHFEDLELVRFHEQILLRDGGHPRFTEADRATARDLVQRRRAAGRPWGWKDPRTSFFLSEWAELVPEATFLLLFREPMQVVDSMCRRKEQDPNTRAANSGALGSWIGHNRELLRFYRAHRDRCVLINLERAVQEPARFVDVLRSRAGLALEAELFQACYDPQLLRLRPPAHRPVSPRLRLQAALLYRALLRHSSF